MIPTWLVDALKIGGAVYSGGGPNAFSALGDVFGGIRERQLGEVAKRAKTSGFGKILGGIADAGGKIAFDKVGGLKLSIAADALGGLDKTFAKAFPDLQRESPTEPTGSGSLNLGLPTLPGGQQEFVNKILGGGT